MPNRWACDVGGRTPKRWENGGKKQGDVGEGIRSIRSVRGKRGVRSIRSKKRKGKV